MHVCDSRRPCCSNGGIKWERKGEVTAAGFEFSFEVGAGITVGRIERRNTFDLKVCPNSIAATGRFDIVQLDFGKTVTASGSLKAKIAGILDFSGTADATFKTEAKLGLAGQISSSGGRCLTLALLGTAGGKASWDAYLEAKGKIKAGKVGVDVPFGFTWGWKDQELAKGGVFDSPIGSTTICF